MAVAVIILGTLIGVMSSIMAYAHGLSWWTVSIAYVLGGQFGLLAPFIWLLLQRYVVSSALTASALVGSLSRRTESGVFTIIANASEGNASQRVVARKLDNPQ